MSRTAPVPADELAALSLKPFHTAKEFNRFTGIGINEVRDRMRDGRLPVVPGVGGGSVIDRRLAMRWLREEALRESAKRRAAAKSS